MRLHPNVEKGRILGGNQGSKPGDRFGTFYLAGPNNTLLKVVLCCGIPESPWEHAIVSPYLIPRYPKWDEMEFVKGLFFDDKETVIQFHAKKSKEGISFGEPYCLHLWRPINQEMLLPPQLMA